MKVIWAILCQSSAVDRDTNVVSLFNIVEELVLPAPPPTQPPAPRERPEPQPRQFVIPFFQVVILWARSDPAIPELNKGRVRVLLPGDLESTSQEVEVDLTQNPRARHRINLAGLPVSRDEGVYRFVVDTMTQDSGWTQAFELPLQVTFQRQDPG